jgi:tripartite-type tricarboxylate transporter receptor subunit TctC
VWHGIYAPKGTPQPVLQKVNEALRAALKDPVVLQRLTELGAEVVPESKQTPEGLSSWLKKEIDVYAPLIRAAGVYAD